jgi:hypothetical protein
MNVRPKQKTKLGCGNKQRGKKKKKLGCFAYFKEFLGVNELGPLDGIQGLNKVYRS